MSKYNSNLDNAPNKKLRHENPKFRMDIYKKILRKHRY